MIQKTIFVFAVSFIVYINCGPTRQSGQSHQASLSDCQQRRDREARVNISSPITIECNEDGTYKALQCFGTPVKNKGRFCACYDNDYNQIKGPSTKLKSCNCVREYHEKTHHRGSQQPANVHIPSCDTVTGEYEKKQCDDSHHWCVNSDTGAQLGQKLEGGCSATHTDQC